MAALGPEGFLLGLRLGQEGLVSLYFLCALVFGFLSNFSLYWKFFFILYEKKAVED